MALVYFLSGPVNFGDFFISPIASQSSLINYFDHKLKLNSILDLSTNTSPAPLPQFEVDKITLNGNVMTKYIFRTLE